MGRLGVDNRNEPHRNIVISAGQHGRRCIGEAKRHIAGADLFNCLRGTLAAQNIDVEIRLFVVALLDRDEKISMPPEETRIGNHAYFVLRGGRHYARRNRQYSRQNCSTIEV